MAYKIAFASSDGKVVNQHFGRAQKFLIVEIGDNEYKYIETRDNSPSCQNFEHTDEAMDKAISIIEDCEAVFVAKVGQGAQTKLKAKGITPFETPYYIEDVIDKLLKSKVSVI